MLNKSFNIVINNIKLLILGLVLLGISVAAKPWAPNFIAITEKVPPSDDLTSEEVELYHLIMEYRRQNGLPKIPISKSLTHVAKLHAKDLQDNFVRGTACNMHSWSDKGHWTPCCYTSDHAQAKCIWEKPRELTSYKGNGYEIAHWNSASASPQSALDGWKKSSGHNAVIINANNWSKLHWKAIGIAIYKDYAIVWFGSEEDDASTTIQIQSPSAKIEKTWVEHHIVEKGETGMKIHAAFSVNNMLNKQGLCAAWFYNSDGKALKATSNTTSNRYRTPNGFLAVSSAFTPKYEFSKFTDFELFIPYSEFGLNEAELHSVKFNIGVFGNQSNSMASSQLQSLGYVEQPIVQKQVQSSETMVTLIGSFTPKGSTKDDWSDCDWCQRCGRLLVPDPKNRNSSNPWYGAKNHIVSFDGSNSWPENALGQVIKVWAEKKGDRYYAIDWEYINH